MSIEVYAPASMGNVSVGFDLLGAALAPIDGTLLGDKVTVLANKKGISLKVSGQWAHKLPKDEKLNIVYQCAEYFLSDNGNLCQGVELHLEKNLPVGSGLGSSASSIVAAFYGLNQFFEEPYSPHELLQLMGEFEGKISGSIHFDNVAPCYLGGMQLMLQLPNRICEPIPTFRNWYWVIAYSGVSLSTAKMRDLLPQQFDRQTSIDFGRYLASFIHASYRDDADLALSVLKDVLAEPYRAPAIPGFIQAKNALQAMGMAVSGISGSGPTLFSITNDLTMANNAADWLKKNYLATGDGFVHICQLDYQGTRRV